MFLDCIYKWGGGGCPQLSLTLESTYKRNLVFNRGGKLCILKIEFMEFAVLNSRGQWISIFQSFLMSWKENLPLQIKFISILDFSLILSVPMYRNQARVDSSHFLWKSHIPVSSSRTWWNIWHFRSPNLIPSLSWNTFGPLWVSLAGAFLNL